MMPRVYDGVTYLNRQETQARLGNVSETTYYRLVHEGQLTQRRFPKDRRSYVSLKEINAVKAPVSKRESRQNGHDYLTIPEVARRLNVSEQHIYHLKDAGDLEAINIAVSGKRPLWRVASEEVERFQRARVKK